MDRMGKITTTVTSTHNITTKGFTDFIHVYIDMSMLHVKHVPLQSNILCCCLCIRYIPYLSFLIHDASYSYSQLTHITISQLNLIPDDIILVTLPDDIIQEIKRQPMRMSDQQNTTISLDSTISTQDQIPASATPTQTDAATSTSTHTSTSTAGISTLQQTTTTSETTSSHVIVCEPIINQPNIIQMNGTHIQRIEPTTITTTTTTTAVATDIIEEQEMKYGQMEEKRNNCR